VKFILATTDPQKIPVTVLSRCLQFNLKQMPQTHIVEHLTNILGQEGVPFEPAALRHIAKGAAGSMRDALSLLDQAIAHGAGKVEEAGVRDMLGTVGDDYLFSLLDALRDGDVNALMAVAESMDSRSLSFDSALQELATLFHRVAMAQFAPQAIADDAERQKLAPYAAAFDPEFLQLCYQIAIHGREDLDLAPDEYAGFTMTLLRLHAFKPESGGGARAPARSQGAGASSAAVSSAGAAPGRSAMAAVASAGSAAVGAPAARPAVAPASAAPSFAPAASASTTLSSAPASRDAFAAGGDDWHSIAASLPGMVRQLAQHCELVGREGALVRLRLDPAHKHLQAHQEKLRTALSERWGDVRIELSVAAPEGATPAARVQNEKRERQERAVAAIEEDPFVQAAINLFDASIDESTIKPV
jgi:DNA polymerase-3 subunit gamma/tau